MRPVHKGHYRIVIGVIAVVHGILGTKSNDIYIKIRKKIFLFAKLMHFAIVINPNGPEIIALL